MRKALLVLSVFSCLAACGGGSKLPAGSEDYVASGCKELHKDGLQTYFNCTGNIIEFRDQIAIPTAKKQGATVDPRYVMVFKKGTYTISVTKGQYEIVDGQAEADTAKPGYGMMILEYKIGG